MTSVIEVGGSRSASRLLVGRDGDLARLESLVEEIVAGAAARHRRSSRGRPASARPGSSTSWPRGSRERDVDVLVGHCVAQGGQTLPYAPLVELLGELVRREGATAVRTLGRSSGDGARPARAGAAGPRWGRARRQPGRQQAVPGPLHAAPRTSACADRSSLVVEDVHWADTSTRELLALLARQQQRRRVLLLTLRTDESPVPAGLARYVAELVRRSEQRVRLDPLTRDQQARQISDILGVPPRARAARRRLRPRGGQPVLRRGAARSRCRRRPASCRPRSATFCWPGSRRLPPATRQVLRTASLVGREVPYRLLEAVVDVAGDRLEAALRDAVEAHVLRSRGRRAGRSDTPCSRRRSPPACSGRGRAEHTGAWRRRSPTSPDLAGARYARRGGSDRPALGRGR